jgi:hypothetical protein
MAESKSFAEEMFGDDIDVRKSELDPRVFKKLYSYPEKPHSYPLNKRQVSRYIKACDPSIQDIVTQFFEVTTHVSYKEFKATLVSCFDEFFEFVRKRKANAIYIYFPQSHHNMDKSNFWVAQHFTMYCFENKIDMTNIHFVESRINVKLDGTNVCMILDDGSYSGSQIEENMSHLYSYDENDIILRSRPMSSTNGKSSSVSKPKPLRSYVFLMIPYMTQQAIDRVKRSFKAYRDNLDNKLHIRLIMPKNMVIMKTLGQLMKRSDIVRMFSFMTKKTDKDPYPDDKHSVIEKSCPIYFDHKLPDTWSSYPQIYNGIVLNENSRPGGKHDVIPVITNCENMKTMNSMKPLCPYPPYKSDYTQKLEDYMNPPQPKAAHIVHQSKSTSWLSWW